MRASGPSGSEATKLSDEGPDGDPLYVWPGHALVHPGRCDIRRSRHATVASAVAIAEISPTAELIFHTPAGCVSITTFQNESGDLVAELTSVAPRVSQPEPDLVSAVLHALRWSPENLDPAYPVMLAHAGWSTS